VLVCPFPHLEGQLLAASSSPPAMENAQSADASVAPTTAAASIMSSDPSGKTRHDKLIWVRDARSALAVLALKKLMRARGVLQLAHVFSKWSMSARNVLVDQLVRDQLVPLLTCRAHAVTDMRPDPDVYVAFGDELSARDVDVLVLRHELVALETRTVAAELKLSAPALQRHLSGESLAKNLECPSSPAGRSGVRSPTPTDFSETATSFQTPSRFRANGGLTLKQLSEGDRALSAAVERELRRAADLAKAKQRIERLDGRLTRATQELRAERAENERLRAMLARSK